MHYSTQMTITQNTWNNSFSYTQRKEHLWKAEITIPSLIKGTLEDVTIGDHIVFEEIDHKGNLRQCQGLQKLVHIPALNSKFTAPIYIIDNHNHALYFRYKETYGKNLDIIHIDQHSDLAEAPSWTIPPFEKGDKGGFEEHLNDIRHYTNYVCNVGNFIKPFLSLHPKSNFTRIKSESQLLNLNTSKLLSPNSEFILDIDLDFRDPNMSIENKKETIEKTKQLMKHASLITIATSPYFLDQTHALKLLNKLFQ